MPGWTELLEEIKHCKTSKDENAFDVIRKKYLLALHHYTKKNIIAYYSGFLQQGNVFGIDINDLDINGFMTTIHKLDCSKGLDLILHTPGGGISATERIVEYLKSKFNNNIRAIVPQIALSAGTMISCSCKEILMGKQSCLCPFDPQVNGFSAIRVIEEFNNAIESIKKDPDVIPLWQMIIAKYYPTVLDSCKFASERAAIMVKTWLTDNMFSDVSNPNNEAEKFIQEIQKIGMKDDHDKHISANHCKSLGLKIAMLEDDQKLQELVLTIHHAYMLTFHSCTLVKIIENHNVITGKVYFYLRLSDFIF